MSEPKIELVGYKEHTQDEEPASKDAPKDSVTEPQENADGGDRSEGKLEPNTPTDVPKPKDAATFESDTKVDLSSAAHEQRYVRLCSSVDSLFLRSCVFHVDFWTSRKFTIRVNGVFCKPHVCIFKLESRGVNFFTTLCWSWWIYDR